MNEPEADASVLDVEEETVPEMVEVLLPDMDLAQDKFLLSCDDVYSGHLKEEARSRLLASILKRGRDRSLDAIFCDIF